MASENSDPNILLQQRRHQHQGRVKNLVQVFEKMKILSSSSSSFSSESYSPRTTLAHKPKLPSAFSRRGVSKANAKSTANGKPQQENQDSNVTGNPNEFVERWAFTGLDRPLAERQPNSLSDDFEHSNVNCEDDHSDTRSSQSGSLQSTETTESSCGGRSRCKNGSNSSESGSLVWKNWTEAHNKKIVKVTSAQPFKLRTEQRGQIKEQQFMKKIQQILEEEEKHRIPIAQGLPWTTDVPQILPRPLVKEKTKPLDVKLHTETRAIERAEFDHLIEEKFHFLEQQRLEEQRLKQLAEEEEIKRLRKAMIPHAQLMPFFDRPLIPKKSTKSPTIPKEPKFHYVNHAKCALQNALRTCNIYKS